jgi:signal transduction histidine kinase/DNA-binding response OmpR family regulator
MAASQNPLDETGPMPLIADRVNILVVDDLPDKLLALHSVLEELDQNLVMVKSGSEALQEVLRREFAVILLDVNMPDIDGIETASLIRKYKRSAHTPIIFITAYADELQTSEGYSLGAVDYILSPVLPNVLRSKVKVFVELFQMQQRTRLMAEERVARARAEAARTAAEDASRRSAFLSHASRELGGSLDLHASMQRLLDLVVPSMAEFGLVLIDDKDDEGRGEGRKVLVSTEASRRTSMPHSLGGPIDLPEALALPLDRALREGQLVQAELPAGEHPTDMRCALALPLKIGERTTGVLLLATRVPCPAFETADVSMLSELAGRGAIALENAALYRNLQREISRSRQAEEKLQDANRRKDEFLAMLSHELRNPLAPIRTAVEVIRRVAPADPALTMARDVVDRQVAHLIRLVEELLDVSRIIEGKITLKKGTVDLAQIIRHSVETARPLIEARGQRLDVEVPSAPVRLFGDFTRLTQVVGNLLTNAAKYTQEGGRIEVDASAADGMAVIGVRDNGGGIDPYLLPRVFDLFVQGDRSLDRSQGGLGVGLTLVKRLVELHQGRVEAFSEGAGKGSSFKVYLPCVTAVQDTPGGTEKQQATPAKNRGHRVLVVDDNVDAAESIAVFLQLYGHEVKTAVDGLQALASSQVFAPEVIVLDIGLPGIDGFEVARRMREDVQTRNALLIAVTGYGQKEDHDKATAAGFDAFYVKPADPREIQACIVKGRVHEGQSQKALGRRVDD